MTCHIVGEPTHRAGNTLDLVWSNVDGARAWVDRGECVTSDHFPIRGQIPVRNSVMRPEKAKLRVTKEKLPRYAKVIAQWVRPPPVLDTIERVEEYAEEICFHLTNAINAVGTRPKARCGRSAPWWTPECKAAFAEYKSAITPSQRALSAKKLRSVVKTSKKEFKTQQVESITTPTDVFKLMRMDNPRQASIPPPLNHNGTLIIDPLKRATILRDSPGTISGIRRLVTMHSHEQQSDTMGRGHNR